MEPFKLPPLTRLMLADIDAGSDTPSLVGKVLKWRKDKPEEANALWDTIWALNKQLSATVNALGDMEAENPVAYAKAVKYISTIQSVQVRALSRLSFVPSPGGAGGGMGVG